MFYIPRENVSLKLPYVSFEEYIFKARVHGVLYFEIRLSHLWMGFRKARVSLIGRTDVKVYELGQFLKLDLQTKCY